MATKVKVEFTFEISDHQTKQAVRMLQTAAYLSADETDSKRAVASAIRRYCKDWGYVAFLQSISKYVSP